MIRSPSDLDVKLSREDLESLIAEYKRDINTKTTLFGATTNLVQILEGRIAEIQNQLRVIPDNDSVRDVGCLFSSHRGVSSDGQILDWSLTKLEHCSMTNKVPEEIYRAESITPLRDSEDAGWSSAVELQVGLSARSMSSKL